MLKVAKQTAKRTKAKKVNKHLDSSFCLLSPLELANMFNFYILKGDYSPSVELANRLCHSLRADKIKLWLTPSAKQRQNPCSGLPAVYPDLSTGYDWPVKKGLCFVCCDSNQFEGKFETHLR